MRLEAVSFETDLTREFARHWLTLPREGNLPCRRDFDPFKVPRLMPYLIMHQIENRKRMTIRLAGTALVERYGSEITGRDYLDLVPEERRESALAAMLRASDIPCGILVQNLIRSRNGRLTETEALGLPLLYEQQEPPMYLFLAAPKSIIGYEQETETEQPIFVTSDRKFVDIGYGEPDMNP